MAKVSLMPVKSGQSAHQEGDRNPGTKFDPAPERDGTLRHARYRRGPH
jgi:hypothetical protein